MGIKFFEVGGAVRDEIMGIESHDVDFTVVAGSWDEMLEELKNQGFRLYQIREEFLTVRAGVPQFHPLYARTRDADFVLARKDGIYLDGRRPETVQMGTIEDDLSRRDFTVNAIAKDCDTGKYIDPFHGIKDIRNHSLRFVGSPLKRIKEDGLRVMRGYRFQISHQLIPTEITKNYLSSSFAAQSLSRVSVDRIREELNKVFALNTKATIKLLGTMEDHTLDAIFRDGLRLNASMRKT